MQAWDRKPSSNLRESFKEEEIFESGLGKKRETF